ncbi:MAG: hypothetical protein JEZ10_04995 [Verrucomicrobia bacterium]|nr:hypothetical protein [Verrucomicrobiota bacterium]
MVNDAKPDFSNVWKKLRFGLLFFPNIGNNRPVGAADFQWLPVTSFLAALPRGLSRVARVEN